MNHFSDLLGQFRGFFKRFVDSEGAIKGPPEHWEQFSLCLMFHLGWPALPLISEWWAVGGLKTSTLALGASMYAMSVGVSSRSSLQFGVGFAIGVVFALVFGYYAHVETSQTEIPAGRQIRYSAVIGMISVFIMHACERYNRHVIKRQPFFEFMTKREKGE